MKRFVAPLGLLAIASLLAPLVFAQSFSTTDKLLILVKGNVASTSQFGYSGQASLYQSTGSNADGTIQFSPVSGAQDVPVERNSTADFTNFSNYGTGGFIPPGVYFLHYHRLDLSISIRHRLGLSDQPGAETIFSGPANVQRTALQFHIAFNNLAEFNQHVSEGCITLKTENFSRLYPDALFDNSQSPLAAGSADANELQLQGSTSNVLVFVTDVLSPGAQDQQLTQFNQILHQLKTTDFDTGSSSQLPQIRVQWMAQPAAHSQAPLLLPMNLASTVTANDTGTVSIVGKNKDTSDPKAFGLTLVITNTTWIESEPGNTSHFFTTKRGSYVRINNVVSLLDAAKKEVGRLNNIVPDSAKKGDSGNGDAEESGIVFQWEVK